MAIEKTFITKEGYKNIVYKINRDPNEPYIIDQNVAKFHYTGYIVIEKSHPLYGKDYDCNLPELKNIHEKNKNKVIGKDIGYADAFCELLAQEDDTEYTMCNSINIHGGITYSDNGFTGYENEWWIGFDCAHCGDNNVKCDIEFVTKELERLSEQLKEIEHENQKN